MKIEKPLYFIEWFHINSHLGKRSPDTNSRQMTQGGAERIEPFLIYRNL